LIGGPKESDEAQTKDAHRSVRAPDARKRPSHPAIAQGSSGGRG
jgi:hypothetical protein